MPIIYVKYGKIEYKEKKELKKKITLTTLISILVLSTSFSLQFCKFGTANPIPVPTLLMPEEYINATIFPSGFGMVCAEVNGTYPFSNLGHTKVTMYYPVPPGSDEISVKMNETSLEWSYCDENYPTVIGDFPLINWTIEPVPDFFEIRTRYCCPIPTDGNLTFLYAMGTGRYLESYAKNTTPYVSINISKEVAPKENSINVYTVGYNETTGVWIWKPANYTVTQANETWSVSLTEISEPFQPLEEDFFVTIEPGGSVSGVNDDLELTMSIDKTTIVIGEVLEVSLILKNIGNDTLTIWFGSGQCSDIYLYYMGVEVARWSYGYVFPDVYWEWCLEPNQTFDISLSWNFFPFDFDLCSPILPPPGEYEIVGVCFGHFSGMWPAVTIGKLPIELILPDCDGDYDVDSADLFMLAPAYGSSKGDPLYNPACDFDEDGDVDSMDLFMLAASYGKPY